MPKVLCHPISWLLHLSPLQRMSSTSWSSSHVSTSVNFHYSATQEYDCIYIPYYECWEHSLSVLYLGQYTSNMPSQLFLDMAHQTDIQGYHNVCNHQQEDQWLPLLHFLAWSLYLSTSGSDLEEVIHIQYNMYVQLDNLRVTVSASAPRVLAKNRSIKCV